MAWWVIYILSHNLLLKDGKQSRSFNSGRDKDRLKLRKLTNYMNGCFTEQMRWTNVLTNEHHLPLWASTQQYTRHWKIFWIRDGKISTNELEKFSYPNDGLGKSKKKKCLALRVNLLLVATWDIIKIVIRFPSKVASPHTIGWVFICRQFVFLNDSDALRPDHDLCYLATFLLPSPGSSYHLLWTHASWQFRCCSICRSNSAS